MVLNESAVRGKNSEATKHSSYQPRAGCQVVCRDRKPLRGWPAMYYQLSRVASVGEVISSAGGNEAKKSCRASRLTGLTRW
jgi:hypothetical protein